MNADSARDRLVVFGDDRSSGADVGWLWINSQRWPGWSLDVLTAERPPIGAPVPAEEARPHPVQGSPTRTTFAEPGFARVRFLEARADPRSALCAYGDASLMVVGTSSSGLGPWHIGSTTEWLLHGPPTPLLLARSGRAVRRVLIAADGSSHASAAIGAFLDLPWSTETEARVLTVKDGTLDPEAVTESVLSRLADNGVSGEARIAAGSPHRLVLAETAASDIDLIVAGTRGLSGLRRLRLGSTASAVARHAPCSVLVAQSRSDDPEDA